MIMEIARNPAVWGSVHSSDPQHRDLQAGSYRG
jgi:hypothetical protein